MRVALIANPHASRFSGRQRDRVVAAIGARHKLELLQTGHPGQATELAAQAVAELGCEVVAVLGGDGTVNEVVNGLRDTDVALALLGGGRVNVLARGLGLPADPDRATARLLDLLDAGARRRLTLGLASERCFALNAGLGLGGAIVREVERRQRAKQLYGDRAYVAAGLKALLVDYDRDHPHLTVHLPHGRPPLHGFFTLVGNGDPFTYLGRRPFRPTPQATWAGGLDLLVGQTMATRSLARAVTGMLAPHPRAGYPGLPVLHDLDEFSLSADIPLPFQLDGEYVGDRTSVTFGCLRSALAVVAPPKLA
ncbi:MAG TPA: diacylglycerol kinase family protein [Actinomycetota bacterium]|nr:diacylglycerol kinase family protein [Actinomycetota bacterium]